MDSRLSKVIDMIRSRRGDLQESPTMSAGAGGFTGSAAATGPVAGYDPVLNIIDRRKKKNKNYPEYPKTSVSDIPVDIHCLDQLNKV